MKCKHLHLGPPHHFKAYHINSLVIDSVTSHKDLGTQFDDQLKFHEHTSEVCTKANRILGMIKKSFEHLDIHMVSKLFTTLVRPTLEYSNFIWGPHFVLDQRKIEKVQRRATKMISQLQDVSYGERLSVLSLPSLSHRRFRGDLIMLYKVLNGYFNSNFPNLYTFSTTSTRGHHLKLFKYRSRLLCRSNYFFNKIINDWNNYQQLLWTVTRLIVLNLY